MKPRCWVQMVLVCFAVLALPAVAAAANIISYSDTISNSQPGELSNHTFRFTVLTDISPGGVLELDFPSGFVLSSSSGTFSADHVELFVNDTPRTAGPVATPVDDGVTIVRGAGGRIQYELNSATGLSANDELELRVGNHTSNAYQGETVFSTSTGTTTIPGDPPAITNPDTVSTHTIPLTISGAAETVNANFMIATVNPVGIGPADTTEEIPPFRFNGAPSTTVGGTTLSVEISLETDEFSVCKWSQTSGVAFGDMSQTFTNTGLVVHSQVVAITRGELNEFFVRCIDDEGNFNTDDYVIAFSVNEQPTGVPNAEGNVEGDGTGSGNAGTGDGGGGGGQTGESEGDTSNAGTASGGGSGGGGSGGRTGADSDGDAGGGLEFEDGYYPSGDAEVIVSGYAFPGSEVFMLVDGVIVESADADSDGSYEITLEEIARGGYTFGVYAVDANDVQSSVFSTSFTVSGGRVSSLSNINVMPSVAVNPDPVNPGEVLTVSGYTLPGATVTIENERDGAAVSRKEFTTTANDDGEWSQTIETDSFSNDTYKVRARAENGSVSTNFSEYTFYGVGQEADGQMDADLNTDGSVNLTDFSILLFWWGSDGGDSAPPADINQDGSVSLTDFSIMLFQWTG